MIRIRKVVMKDVPFIAEIYDKIHTQEESGKVTIGWDCRLCIQWY